AADVAGAIGVAFSADAVSVFGADGGANFCTPIRIATTAITIATPPPISSAGDVFFGEDGAAAAVLGAGDFAIARTPAQQPASRRDCRARARHRRRAGLPAKARAQ